MYLLKFMLKTIKIPVIEICRMIKYVIFYVITMLINSLRICSQEIIQELLRE